MRTPFSILALTLAATAPVTSAHAHDFTPGAQPPAAARPGQCFGQVSTAGATHRSSERVLVAPAHTVTRWEPAVTRWSEHRELVRAAWTETVRTPAVYRTVVETVWEPGVRRTVTTAPRYRRVVERVLAAPARVVWRPAHGRPGYGGEAGGYARALQPTGEVLCRVVIPARYVTHVRWVQTAPGCRCEVEGPPVRRRVSHRELVRAEQVSTRTHAAVYRTVRTCEIVRPGRAYTVTVPARWRTVEHVHRGERRGWSPVVCPNGLAPWAMARLQAALNARGYDAGPEDGQGRRETYEALARFQHDHHLPAGQITVESARALGVVE